MKDNIITAILSVTAAALTGIVIALSLVITNTNQMIAALHPTCEYTYVNRMEDIAEPMLNAYFKAYSIPDSNIAKEDAFLSMELKSATLIAGDSEQFAVSAIFKAYVNDPSRHLDWGILDKNSHLNCEWTLIIKKTGSNQYTLLKIINHRETLAALQSDVSMPTLLNNTALYDYKIENESLFVTYDRGANFKKVLLPCGVSDFGGFDESGHAYTVRLPEGSSYITEERTAFAGFYRKKLSVILSEDSGMTWKSYFVSDDNAFGWYCPAVTFSPDGKIGYLSVNADKAMSSSASLIYKTTDGGETWECLGTPNNDYYRISKYITAASNQNVFLTLLGDGGILASYDGGRTWDFLMLKMPQEMAETYTYYNPPKFDGSDGEILIGTSYKSASNIQFVTHDSGKTWQYQGEVVSVE